MSSKVKVTVSISKTIQEQNYQPCTILLEQETTVPEDEAHETRNNMFIDLNEDLNAFFKNREEGS